VYLHLFSFTKAAAEIIEKHPVIAYGVMIERVSTIERYELKLTCLKSGA
jgi:hypothetical protein